MVTHNKLYYPDISYLAITQRNGFSEFLKTANSLKSSLSCAIALALYFKDLCIIGLAKRF